MQITQKFASLNRKRMRDKIVAKMNFTIVDEFESIHNYLDIKTQILRKALQAPIRKGFIPINMRDGSLIASGR